MRSLRTLIYESVHPEARNSASVLHLGWMQGRKLGVVPALRSLSEENCSKFKASLRYTARNCLKKKKK